MEATFHSNRVITVTALTGVMSDDASDLLDICSEHIVCYADGQIHTVDGHVIRVHETRMGIRHLMETALLT